MGPLLRRSLEEAPVVRFRGYDYFVHPLTDGIPQVEASLLDEIVEEVLAVAAVGGGDPDDAAVAWQREVDRIVTVEAMGIPLATALSLATDVPVTVVRKRKYGLEGEVEIAQRTGYSKGALYVNGLKRGDRVVFIDDVVSTGGTLIPILHALRNLGVQVVDCVVVVEKGEGRARVEKETGVRVKTLARVDVQGGRVVVDE